MRIFAFCLDYSFSSFTTLSLLATLSLSENEGEDHSTVSRLDRGESPRLSKRSYYGFSSLAKVPTPKVRTRSFAILMISFFLFFFLHGFFTIRVESVAHGLIYAIRCAQNGSIWISEQGKPVYEVQPSDSLPQKTDRGEEQRS